MSCYRFRRAVGDTPNAPNIDCDETTMRHWWPARIDSRHQAPPMIACKTIFICTPTNEKHYRPAHAHCVKTSALHEKITNCIALLRQATPLATAYRQHWRYIAEQQLARAQHMRLHEHHCVAHNRQRLPTLSNNRATEQPVRGAARANNNCQPKPPNLSVVATVERAEQVQAHRHCVRRSTTKQTFTHNRR